MKKFLVLIVALICEGALLTGCGGTAPRGEVREEPPALWISCGESGIEAAKGTYSWHYGNCGVAADAMHPLETKRYLDTWTVEPGTDLRAELRFDLVPDEVSVRCWNEQYWGDTSAESEALPVQDFSFDLKPGGYIYEVCAQWTSPQNCGGTAYYSFYAVTSPTK